MNPNYGEAKFNDLGSFSDTELFYSHVPLPVTENFPVAANQTIEAFTVVGLSSGNLVIADGSTVKPIGVLTQKVVTGADAISVAVWRSGYFRKEALVFHSGYNTDALKIAAFRDAAIPMGTDIKVA